MRPLLIALLLAVAGFNQPTSGELVTVPPGVTTDVTMLPNSCLVAALEMEAALRAQHDLKGITWTKVARVGYGNWSRKGHAYCLYSLFNGDIYSYDIVHGSHMLNTRDRSEDSLKGALKAVDPKITAFEFLD
jgi:hypothetical protein